ncbi:MAG: glycosyl hydrolase family 28-related protein [Deltaproteobacteria bacterium]
MLALAVALATIATPDYCTTPRLPPTKTKPAGAACIYSDECGSGYCVPDGRGRVCAGQARVCGIFGSDWVSARLVDCADPTQLESVCVPRQTTPTCAGQCTVGEACGGDLDCTAGPDDARCLVEPGADGVCISTFARQASCPEGFDAFVDGTRTMCRLPESTTTLSSIRDGHAVCDGVSDDGLILQTILYRLEQHGGGTLYLPPCTHFMDRTLIVSDHVTIVGHGPDSVLRRGDTHTWRPLWSGADCNNAQASGSFDDWGFITNDNYNCTNVDIVLQDFALDGHLVYGKTTASQGLNAAAISLSGLRDSVIEGLTIRDVTQDGIFLRNGGVNVIVRNNVIDGFSMRWHNAGGINVEFHASGNNRGQARIENNHVIVRAPSLASSQVSGINVNRRAGTPYLPSALVLDNVIEVGDSHGGIDIQTGAVDTVVEGNLVQPYWGNGGLVGFRGIAVSGELVLAENTVIGGDRAVDARAILYRTYGTPATIVDNIVDGWVHTHDSTVDVVNAYGIVSIQGTNDFDFARNQIIGTQGGYALRFGYTYGQSVGMSTVPWTENGRVEDNVVTNGTVAAGDARVTCHPAFACDLTFSGNQMDVVSTFCGTTPCP